MNGIFVYTFNKKGSYMEAIAKVFISGNSQAIRIPKENKSRKSRKKMKK